MQAGVHYVFITGLARACKAVSYEGAAEADGGVYPCWTGRRRDGSCSSAVI
jgi:hypothetical protein